MFVRPPRISRDRVDATCPHVETARLNTVASTSRTSIGRSPSRAGIRLVVFGLLVGLPIPLAIAQDAPPKRTKGAPHAPHAPRVAPAQPPAVIPVVAVASPSPENAPPAPLNDTDGDDDHGIPTPAPKTAPIVRQQVTMKEGMLRIPGGHFTMGSQERTSPPNERPARAVTVNPFWIDRTEVTVGAYTACVQHGSCPRPVRQSSACTYDLGDPALPVSCIPWTSAHAFCTASGKRLPREVEWEFAARGTSGARGGGGCGVAATLVKDGSQRSCAGAHPSRVGAHPGGASPFGVLDMSGNVEEWVADWYGESVSDLSPRAGASHVLRGGGWLSPPSLAKTTSRNWGSVREAGPNVGFRCARDE